ncbi:MAG: hypothetical protein A2571_01410 [Candidatus Vogelbacteria bacterium RIFOXYD1_FULL_44_32]|uniref:Polysaccharide biosynthesis protein C-terminal domain-containing protein n=1 Tax=Candidatus Vogelbacteria bacterium RIFOXYD1_FULL_44_32 TaxID=1802438 RepID=A0A1G2QED0_9BACT|nr:MAG: hypothetical protein A2571_01410 [Candidatus Vogelbacteria bacterium RIFOXYD1_FULL_44_32]
MLQVLQVKFYRFLRWSEQYTKTDMVYMAKGGSWLVASQVISSLCSLVLVIAFANLIPAELYGKYRYVISIIGILAVATFPGLNSVAITSVAQGHDSTFWKLLYRRTLWSFVSTLAGFFIASYYYLQGNNELALVFVVAAVATPLLSTSGMYAAFLNGKKDFQRLAQWSTIAKFGTTGALVLALFFVKSLWVLFLVYFIPELIIESIFLWYLYRHNIKGVESEFDFKKYSHFGFHLSLMEVFKIVASQIDKILVFHYLGATQLAVYAIATTAPGQIKSLFQNMTTLALPKLSAVTEEDIRVNLPQKLLRLELLILGFVALYWIVAPVLFPLFFPQYAEAVFISQIFSLSLLFFPRTFLSTAMTVHLKKTEMYWIRIVAPAIRIIVFAIALPWWGLWGAIIGSIVSGGLTAFVYQYFFRRAFRGVV